MIEEFRKSIASALDHRLRSPFYGTFFLSWCIWNWKIIYLTFIVSENKISGHKIDFILDNYFNHYDLWLIPFVSTIVLLTLVPFLTNGAYFLNLKFENWRIDKRNEIEGKRLLSVEESLDIRKKLIDFESEFEKIFSEKDNEINQLKALIKQQSEKETVNTVSGSKDSKNNEKLLTDDSTAVEIAKVILSNNRLRERFKEVSSFVDQQGYSIVLKESKFNFFTINRLVYLENLIPKWTVKGSEVNRIVSSALEVENDSLTN